MIGVFSISIAEQDAKVFLNSDDSPEKVLFLNV